MGIGGWVECMTEGCHAQSQGNPNLQVSVDRWNRRVA